MIGALQLVESKSCADAHRQAVEGLIHRLKHNCRDNRRILLLLSGGSNMSVAVQALGQLNGEQLGHITVAQVDERVVPIDSPQSNWNSFVTTFGSIDLLAGTLPILSAGQSMSELVNNYDLELTTYIKDADYSLALIGIGVDGHIAGMKPCHATEFQQFFNDDFVTGYASDDFDRITITDYGLRVLNDIIVFACGKEKRKALEDMKRHIPVHKHPAQLLKVYDRVTMYTSSM